MGSRSSVPVPVIGFMLSSLRYFASLGRWIWNILEVKGSSPTYLCKIVRSSRLLVRRIGQLAPDFLGANVASISSSPAPRTVLVPKFTENSPHFTPKVFHLLFLTTHSTMTEQDILMPINGYRRPNRQLSNEHKTVIIASRTAGLQWSEVASRN